MKFYNHFLKERNILYKKEYKIIPTYDIDIAYSYLGKGCFRNIFGGLRDLVSFNFNGFFLRLKTLLKLSKDPYDVYDYLDQFINKCSIFFIQVGKRGTFDKNLNLNNSFMISLIYDLSQKVKLGIHPSYKSNDQKQVLSQELESLQKVKGGKVILSRQHYLKLDFPNTYQSLIDLGIKQDYTLGYAEDIAFRAGTSYDFYWYNLSEDIQTDLILYPLTLMDVTLKNYLQLSKKHLLIN